MNRDPDLVASGQMRRVGYCRSLLRHECYTQRCLGHVLTQMAQPQPPIFIQSRGQAGTNLSERSIETGKPTTSLASPVITHKEVRSCWTILIEELGHYGTDIVAREQLLLATEASGASSAYIYVMADAQPGRSLSRGRCVVIALRALQGPLYVL